MPTTPSNPPPNLCPILLYAQRRWLETGDPVWAGIVIKLWQDEQRKIIPQSRPF